MDTKSHACPTAIAVAWHCCTLLMIACWCGGCRSTPTNPFLAKHESAEPDAEDPAAKSGKELAAEVEAAMGATARIARDAADQTVAEATERGRAVAGQAALAAGEVARDAGATVQVQAIESLSAWPIEQSGPMLMLALAEGNPVVRRAAAKQLADRWPPAAAFPLDAAVESRQAALAELRAQWVRQYGEINDAVVTAKAHAQQVLDDAQEVADDAKQVSYQAQQLVGAAAESARQVQEIVVSLKQANLPEAARQEAKSELERLAADASWEVRARVAQAMGEAADPTFLPVLMGMLVDQVEVQREALASLTLIVGGDVTIGPDGPPKSSDERVRRWQLWYQEHPAARTAHGPQGRKPS
jgi:HEAT repeat protein